MSEFDNPWLPPTILSMQLERYESLVDQLIADLEPVLKDPTDDGKVVKVLGILGKRYASPLFTLDDYQVIRDTVNGYWSTFPVCCIKSFSIHGIHGKVARATYENYVEVRTEHPFNYVPCKDCFDKRNFLPTESIRKGGFLFMYNVQTWSFIL